MRQRRISTLKAVFESTGGVVVWTDYPFIVAGIETAIRFGLSYWDGAIIAAAERLGAPILYAEDLNHGQRYGSVQAINPFLPRTPDGVHDDRNAGYA